MDSNRPMLMSLAREALPACELRDLGILRDDLGEVTPRLTEAGRQCHMIITSGGV